MPDAICKVSSAIHCFALNFCENFRRPLRESSHFKVEELSNGRSHLSLPEEEPVLMSVRTGKREYLKDMLTVALGLGLGKREQLRLRSDQVDFFAECPCRYEDQRAQEP